MKFNFKLFLYSLIPFTSFSQNLVPNWSFEQFSICPNSHGEIEYCQNWLRFRQGGEYFNSCDITNGYGVPTNTCGYQEPVNGNGYAGIYTFSYSGNDLTSFRDFIGIELDEPLQVGTKYYLSFQTSAAIIGSIPFQSDKFVSNNLGALFTTYFVNPLPILNFAHVYNDSIIRDSSVWTTIRGSIIADSAYTYLVLGNFFSDSLTVYENINPAGIFNFAYYYIENVCLSIDSFFCEHLSGINEYVSYEEPAIYPNPCSHEINIADISTYTTIEILNYLGEKVLSKCCDNNQAIKIDVSTLSAGVYLIIFKNSIYMYQSKLIKI
jgi:hypothetical protein